VAKKKERIGDGAPPASAFGRTPDGVDIERVEISNAAGLRVGIITYGATVQSLVLPDGTDIVLGSQRPRPAEHGYRPRVRVDTAMNRWRTCRDRPRRFP
jgi:hypothetical protein